MKKILIGAAVLASLAAGSVAAQVPADRAVKYRQSALTVMSTSFGRIGAHVKGDIKLDAAQLASNAEVVQLMSHYAFDGFIQGTPQPSTTGKGAKADIWKDWDKFKKLQGDLQANTAKLAAAAKSGNADAIKTAFGDTGKSCKACHDAFRDQ
ncbi:MAG TPA: cytochrome c [Burkholderiales bacterium]|jgi:cytochrome c556